MGWHDQATALTIDARALVGGVRMDAYRGETFDVVSPIDGRVIAQASRGRTADIDRAVQSARSTFDKGSWATMAPAARKRIMLKWADLIVANKNELALLECIDVGKPIQYAQTVDVNAAARCIQWYGEAIDKVYDEIAPTHESALALIRREAMGVIGCIVPWNYPMIMAAWKLGPAIASGNSVVQIGRAHV